jgi:GDP-D-mannose dehydratase
LKVLITGGAGFIGSYLAEAYLARGDEVYVIDDLSTGSLANIQPLAKNPQFHFVNDTILNREAMLELIGICDVIAHLAAAVGVTRSARKHSSPPHRKSMEGTHRFRCRKTISGSTVQPTLRAGAMPLPRLWTNSWRLRISGPNSFRLL